MKIIIAGGRDFKDFATLCDEVSHILLHIEDMDHEIVSGCQVTIDPKTGEKYSKIFSTFD